LIPDEFRAEGLIEAFVQLSGKQTIPPQPILNKGETDMGVLKGTRFLLPRAEVAREIFPERVRELGGEIDVPVAYRTIKPESRGKRLRRFLKEGRISIATFTSAATFNNFREIMGEDADELLKGVIIAAIGPVTAKAIEKAGLHVDIVPKEATIEALVAEIINSVTKRSKESMN
jgi:uroporphyrinogen III methyltransferase/synthase